jgi:hypothetical protein
VAGDLGVPPWTDHGKLSEWVREMSGWAYQELEPGVPQSPSARSDWSDRTVKDLNEQEKYMGEWLAT